MRAELPWNVAGIPPEAREAARAAARREGLSVGEWLTRRILRGLTGLGDENEPMPYEHRAPSGAPLDSWGLPPSAASRRDTEEMMARVGRSEAESNEAWRRIEDQLRGMNRRIDSSERSHSESNRVISRTTQEINIHAREQAQAFDQLGLNVMALNERLERLERSAANDGIKDAVKALHQGLSRLADQITATANNSAGQVVQLSASLEQLSNRVGQARVDAEEGDKLLEQRMDVAESRADARLTAVEKSAQFNTNALDHALEKIEAAATQRATDQVENQRKGAAHEESLNRLEDSIARLEMRLPDAEFERRLDNIERSVTGMADRLEQYDPTEKFDAQMQTLAHRIESLEKDHNDLMAELRAKVLRPVEPPAYEPPAYEAPAYEAPRPRAEARPEPQPDYPPHAFTQGHAFEEPRFAQPRYDEQPAPRREAPLSAFGLPPVAEAPPFTEEPAYQTDPPDAFAHNTPHGFHFEIPPDEASDPFAPTPEFAEVFADAPEQENFLSQARKSARAASDKAEGERRGRFAAFRWGNKEAAAAEASEEKSRSRLLIPVGVALVVALAAAAALVLSQRAPTNTDMAAAPNVTRAPTSGPTYSVPSPPDSNDTQFVVAPNGQGNVPGDAGNYDTQMSNPQGDAAPNPPRPQREARNAPATAAPEANGPAPRAATPQASAGGDRVIQLANAGNPIALTILGLRALDGTGQPANLPDAIKFLTQAAEKGQAVAQYRLGTLYERGQGVPADGAKAAHWYELAAAQGNRKAMHNLAVSYASGAAGRKNMAEAARWFAKAAALGLSDSQFNLAVLYERGDGVPQSLLDAYKWYTIAAAAGDSESKQRVGVLQGQLSDSDKAAANKSAATFHAAPLNRSANVPPEAADLG